MSRRAWDLAGCTTLAWLALAACGKTAGAPVDESGGASAPTAGLAQGGSGAGSGSGASSGSRSDGGSGTAGAAASTAGKQGASGGASGSGGGAPFGGTEDTRGGAPSTADAGASTAGGAGYPSRCNSHYLSCGCGCCTGPTPLQRCVYEEVGPKSIDELVGDDNALRNDTAACAAAGCSLGIDYFACCERPPAQPEVATYEASVYIGDYDRLRLYKRGAVNCSTVAMVSPKLGGEELPVELPTNWAIDQITRLPCISSASGPRAIGAMGKFSLRVSGDACVVDAHLSAFFVNEQGGVDAERFDAEGVPVNLSVAFCK